jgi:protein-L-isoaspartate(D-aspartate) O-methyltransferase
VAAPENPDPYLTRRLAMVETQLRSRGIRDERVLQAMGQVPRQLFVPPTELDHAYSDNPLPIGAGQTISQPYIVAAMVEALALRPEDCVLEIGTGSGYAAAVLAELAREVYTIERQPELAKRARQVLEKLDYKNVQVILSDGTQGLREYAPYDAMLVSAAAPQVPLSLFEQLAEGGRMVIPVGNEVVQELQLIRKISGEAQVAHLDGCRFVPLLGAEGFLPEA